MAGEDIVSEILEYLKKSGPTNTFRLSSVIGIDRAKLLSLLKKLEEKQAIRFEHGNAIFLKFVSEEKPKSKPIEIETSSSLPEHKAKRKSAKPKALQLLQTENVYLQGKLGELKKTINELEKKADLASKTITKTIIKKVPVIKTVVKRIRVSPSPPKKERKNKKELTVKTKLKSLSFKLPRFKLLGNIARLRKPEFIKQ